MPVMGDVIGILLAGGQGERLWPLTRDRAKPAVPFGGAYRIIDVTLSNCINSDLRRVFVLTQYKALSLNRHTRQGWSQLLRSEEHTSELQSHVNLVCRLLLEKKKKNKNSIFRIKTKKNTQKKQ